MLVDSAALLLLGLVLAGLVRLFLNERTVRRHLPGKGAGTVFKAALVGLPLPLCSCSVVPVAWELKRAGVSRGGTVSFLVSTPESGVDSIALTWSLMDPIMTIARPLVAFLTAVVAGLWQTAAETEESGETFPGKDVDLPAAKSVCSDGCCATEPADDPGHQPIVRRVWSGVKYAFTDLIADLSIYLLAGYLLAGLISALWGGPESGLPNFFAHGWGAYLGALVIGLPLYICATSSTPLAAAMIAAGFPPGAALVLLMVGPATNLASLTVVSRMLRPAALVRYLAAIIMVSIACGLALDYLYAALRIVPEFGSKAAGETGAAGTVELVSAVVTGTLILGYSLRPLLRRLSR